MRSFIGLCVTTIVAIAIALSCLTAFGDTSAVRGTASATTLSSMLNSVTASPDVEVTVTGSATLPSSAPATSRHAFASTKTLVHNLSFVATVSSPRGRPLSAAGAKNVDLVVAYRGQQLLDVRAIGATDYFQVNVDALGAIPGVNLGQDAGLLGTLLDGRWFSIDHRELSGLLAGLGVGSPASRPRAKALAPEIGTRMRTALRAAGRTVDLRHEPPTMAIRAPSSIALAPSEAIGARGPVAPVLADFAPVFDVINRAVPPASRAALGRVLQSPTVQQSRYDVAFVPTTTGSLGAVGLELVAPHQPVIGIDVAFGHDGSTVSAPSGSVPFPTSLLHMLGGGTHA